ncbi:Ferritin-3, chloroplastic [Asimina triloba]
MQAVILQRARARHTLVPGEQFLAVHVLALLLPKSSLSLSSQIPYQETMLLRAPAFSLSKNGETHLLPFRSASSSSAPSPALGFGLSSRRIGVGIVAMAAKESNNRPLTGVIFEPFEEVKKELKMVPSVPHDSLARQKYADDCEAAVNEQIKYGVSSSSSLFSADFASTLCFWNSPPPLVEYNVSYVYHALFAYFDRDNVALRGFAKFFKESSEEERQHAEKLMEYQNKRGGRVKLQSIVMPHTEYDHPEKGDALYAMELALSLEKLTNEKLLNLHRVADHCNDAQMADFVESEFLGEQVDAIKKISEFVAQLRRVGKGHGVWHFDQMLLDAAPLH